ncbi:quinone-interacting membrane-bound oxidoreductase complex subunit QmoC [bacterium]|nr:quinone-interacting membrane-bound oxidoreductase complex subunit QmoC [bacterium]
MAEKIIKPNLRFIKEIIGAGGESLKKCYQCATCSVKCNLSPDKEPFPRKEMVNAQWGMKEDLLASPDVWLCHQCGDCTAYCPRGAKPGEVLGAVRKLAIAHYAPPFFLAKMVGNPKFLPLLALFPVILFLAVLGLTGHLHIPSGEIVFSHFIPHNIIYWVFYPTVAFSMLIFLMSISRFWHDMSKESKETKQGFVKSLISIMVEILIHTRFSKCEVNKSRSIAHIATLYGFVTLALTAGLGVIYLYLLKYDSPYPLTDPLKIMGNSGAAALVIGIMLVVINRAKNKEDAGPGTYFDWLLIGTLSVICLTGILSELTRLANIALLAYPIYFIHLSSVFFLFFYAPYSKLAHMVYRTTALIYAKQTKREE